MILGRAPHAVVLSGPGSVGKTTLALDLAAGLLCSAPDPAARPCRACRGCHLVASGNHPDLYRLAPEGPGGQIVIGAAQHPEPGTVRYLISQLALLPVEGGARVAIVEQAHRMNDAAQNALLKMLEEPPAGVTIVLCSDDDECLLPTVRSRCVRVRLGVVGTREIEAWLGELGVADAPQAARLARVAGGRPGLALAYARSPEAERIRGEIARGLVDLLPAGRQARLAAIRDLLKSAASLDASLSAGRRAGAVGDEADTPVRARGRKGKGAAPALQDDQAADIAPDEPSAPKVSAADKRAAAATLLEIWASVGRDLAVARSGGARQLRELGQLNELRAIAPALAAGAVEAFLARLAETDAALDENANSELALDVLVLGWPNVESSAAARAGTGSAAPAGATGSPRE